MVGAAQGTGEEPLMTRVLLTGAAGQLGTDIVAAVLRRSDIELVPTDQDTLDITDLQTTCSRVADVAPQVIIHGAAYTACLLYTSPSPRDRG